KVMFALSLHAVGRYREALEIGNWLLAARPEFKAGTVKSPDEVFAVIKTMREDCISKTPQIGTSAEDGTPNAPRNFLAEAEKILLHPDVLSMHAGIRPTLRPLREMLNSDDL